MKVRKITGVAAGALLLIALWQLADVHKGLSLQSFDVDRIPVTVYRLADEPMGPMVVIAHGFAGSREIMGTFGTTLARAGYTAVTFDFAGHGKNPVPMTGSITEETGATRVLVGQIAKVATNVQERYALGPRYAVLGHSMASDLVVRYANQHPDVVAATIVVSLFSKEITAKSPRNLLIINGSWEPALTELAKPVVEQVAGAPIEVETTYGDFGGGSARRLVLADRAEHIGVLFNAETLRETTQWLDKVFDRQTLGGWVDDRARWAATGILAIVLLWWSLSAVLPRVTEPVGASLRGGWLWLTLSLPALVTPSVLWPLSLDFLPVLVGDYLAVHFGLYGLLGGIVAWRAGALRGILSGRISAFALGLVGTLLMAGMLLALLEWRLISFLPIAERLPLLLAVFVGTLAFFLSDEWITRGQRAPRWACLLSKLAFLSSLGIAVALRLEELFFLLIIMPVIVPLFVIFGLLGNWTYRATGHPWVAGVANALVFAWAIAVTFPLVEG